MKFFLDSFSAALHLIAGFDAELLVIVMTSLKVSLAATLVAACVGVPMGMFVALKRFLGRSFVLIVLNTLMALPTVVVGLVFYGFLSRMGPLGHWGLLFTPTGIVLGLATLSIPIVTNLTLAAIQALDKRLFLTCRLLGATRWQQAWMILKEARFAVTSAIVVAFGRVISEVGIAMMLGGNIRGFTRTMTTAIALETSKGEFALGLALGLVLLSIALAINATLSLLQKE